MPLGLPLIKGYREFVQMVPPLNRMAAIPIYGKKKKKKKKKKTLKNHLRNQESFVAESLYIAWVTLGLQSYKVCSDDDLRMTFDLFMARSDLRLHTDF